MSDGVSVEGLRPPTWDSGFKTVYIHLTENYLEKLISQGSRDNLLVGLQALYPDFGTSDVVAVGIEDTKGGIIACVRLKAGEEAIGLFATEHLLDCGGWIEKTQEVETYLCLACQCGATTKVLLESLAYPRKGEIKNGVGND